MSAHAWERRGKGLRALILVITITITSTNTNTNIGTISLTIVIPGPLSRPHPTSVGHKCCMQEGLSTPTKAWGVRSGLYGEHMGGGGT